MTKIALKGYLERIPDDDIKFQAWCDLNGYHYLGGDRRAWCSSLGTYIRDSKYTFHTESGFPILLREEDFEEVSTLR